MENTLEYIIVQAGGKGTRLEKLTRNKPKALLSVNNKPMIFHLFDKFKSANFIVIGDYKNDVLSKYLNVFANKNNIKYKMIVPKNASGTCAGLNDCLKNIPDNKPFMLVWCDLILSDKLDVTKLDIYNKNYLGISQDFKCRWSYQNGKMIEEASVENGIAGLFIFKNKDVINNVPESGEFVRWLSTQNINFDILGLGGAKEYGIYQEVMDRAITSKCRPFNRLTECILKEGIDEQGRKLAKIEQNWYNFVKKYNFDNLPKIYSLNPLIMQKIDGEPVYRYKDLSIDSKKNILNSVVNCLKNLHKLGEVEPDMDSYYDNYIKKTLSRLQFVRDMIPFANNKFITINGKQCKNFLYYIDVVEQQIQKYYPKKFAFIHGDSTFSNILLNSKNEPILIDPRGYFGKIELYGDIAYDWAKLYYSLYTNYDEFNLKNFDLTINENSVDLVIPKSGWEELKDYYLSLICEEANEEQLNLILSLIWLSLTTYAWDDYDSICGAFYNGILIFNECGFVKEINK